MWKEAVLASCELLSPQFPGGIEENYVENVTFADRRAARFEPGLLNLLKPTGHVLHQHLTTVRSAHTVFMCFVFI